MEQHLLLHASPKRSILSRHDTAICRVYLWTCQCGSRPKTRLRPMTYCATAIDHELGEDHELDALHRTKWDQMRRGKNSHMRMCSPLCVVLHPPASHWVMPSRRFWIRERNRPNSSTMQRSACCPSARSSIVSVSRAKGKKLQALDRNNAYAVVTITATQLGATSILLVRHAQTEG